MTDYGRKDTGFSDYRSNSCSDAGMWGGGGNSYLLFQFFVWKNKFGGVGDGRRSTLFELQTVVVAVLKMQDMVAASLWSDEQITVIPLYREQVETVLNWRLHI